MLTIYIKKMFKSCTLGLNFVRDFARVGEVERIASCIILAVNNNPVEYFPQRLLFCHENNQ